MSAWLRTHADALLDALRRLFAAPLNAGLSLLTIAIALALPAGGLIAIDNLQRLGSGLAGSHEISVFMAPDADKADVAEIERRLKTKLAASDIRFVPKDTALKQLQASEGLGDLLAGLPKNPLPDAFVIRPARNSATGTTAEFDALAKSFAAWPKVAHVQLDSAWVQRLDALLSFGRLFVTVLAAILGAGLLAVVFNTIRLQVMGRREEIELALLIGATPAFVARPFLWFGFVEGLLGGILALVLLAIGLAPLVGPAGELIALYGGHFQPRVLGPEIVGALPASGALLGWTGAWLSAHRLGRA